MPSQDGDTADVRQRRTDALANLRPYLNPSDVTAADHAIERLRFTISCAESCAKQAMLAYGGGKDSSYMVAFVRFMQLRLREQHGESLRLRVITNRHVGMPVAVMHNIDRTYRALQLYGDPDVEMLLVDEGTVRPFTIDAPIPPELTERNRLDVLMTGHRCYGDGRPTFCNACNFSMVTAFAAAAGYGDRVDVVITGDSPAEQRAYLGWVRALARQLDLPSRSLTRFTGFVDTTRQIAGRYFADIHGTDERGGVEPAAEVRGSDPVFFSIYRDTPYESGAHWPLLTELLGFRFDDLAFSFTESDCANPALMAHLRGLRAERVHGTGYQVGVEEYLGFAMDLMRTKDFPETLIVHMHERYATPTGLKLTRERIAAYTLQAYGLTETHLVCMVFSPFGDRGRHLENYLRAEQRDLLPQQSDIHRLLSGDTEDEPLAARLTELSGLDLRRLRTIYRSTLAAPQVNTPIGMMLANDPHKGMVNTRHSPGGPLVLEPISGR